MKAASIIRQETITLTLHSSGRRLCPLPSTSLPAEPADESTVKSISFPRESIHFLAPPSFPSAVEMSKTEGGRERARDGIGDERFPAQENNQNVPRGSHRRQPGAKHCEK